MYLFLKLQNQSIAHDSKLRETFYVIKKYTVKYIYCRNDLMKFS